MKSVTRLLTGAVLACSFSAAHAASDSTLDVSTLTCDHVEEMFKTKPEGAHALLFWLDGYISGVAEDPTLDPEFTDMLVKGIADACKKDGSRNLLEVAREVGLDE